MTQPHETTTEALASLGWRHEPGTHLNDSKRRILCADTGQCIGQLDVVEANELVERIRHHLETR